MATRVLLVLTGVLVLVGSAYVLLSLFALHSVENGVSRHVIDGTGIIRGAIILCVAIILGVMAFVVRPAH